MRNVWSTASIIVLGISVAGARSAAAQDAGFDGTLTYQIHGENGKTMTLVTASKGSKLRVEMADPSNPMRGGAFVIDGDAHTRMMIMTQQKKYIVMPESMTGAMGGMGMGGTGNSPDAANAPKFSFTKTGRTETVAGVSCQVIHGTGTNNGKTQEADICIAKGVGFNPGTWASLGGQAGGGNGMAAVRDAVGPGNGILKMTSTQDGKPEFDVEVTKIDRTPVGDDAFSPPAGYTQIQMPGGMGAGAGAGAPR
jgi:hypothetical protein